MKDKAVIAIIGWALAMILTFNILQARTSNNDALHTAEAGTNNPQAADFDELAQLPPIFKDASELVSEEVQSVTINAVVVEGASQSESTVSEDGTSFAVSSHVANGGSYTIYLALNNSSDQSEYAELVADTEGLTLSISLPESPADAYSIEQKSANRWLISTHPSGNSAAGLFDLLITASSQAQSQTATFKLNMPDAGASAFVMTR